MSNQEPTPDAPAEVCERLKQLHRSLGSTSQDGYKNERATLTAALLLIEQGEKKRERLAELQAGDEYQAIFNNPADVEASCAAEESGQPDEARTNKHPQVRLEVSRDGLTNAFQLSIQLSTGIGYRICGPKFSGNSISLITRELNDNDAKEVVGYIKTAFPRLFSTLSAERAKAGRAIQCRDAAMEQYHLERKRADAALERVQFWQDDANELAQCLVEMVSLMEGVRSGHYKPDSFTNQPSKSALSAHARLKDREHAAREQPTPERK